MILIACWACEISTFDAEEKNKLEDMVIEIAKRNANYVSPITTKVTHRIALKA